MSSQPGSEVLVHIPRKSLGLVKRGFHFEEALSLKSLRVHQVGTFAVTESRDFLVVRIPGAALLQVQVSMLGDIASCPFGALFFGESELWRAAP